MKKPILIVFGVIGGIAVSICLVMFFLFMFVVSGAFAILMPAPPEPNIKYGEFPFSITYEINGEIKRIDDVVICEYEGVESRGTAGKYRVWKSKLKSGNESIVLLHNEENDMLVEKITYLRYGSASYYMGEYSDYNDYEFGKLAYFQYINGYLETEKIISEYEAYEKYGLKILDTKFSSPIKNIFTK